MLGQIHKAWAALKLENKELKKKLEHLQMRLDIATANTEFYAAHYNRKLVITHDYGRCVPAKDLVGKSIEDLLIGMGIVAFMGNLWRISDGK